MSYHSHSVESSSYGDEYRHRIQTPGSSEGGDFLLHGGGRAPGSFGSYDARLAGSDSMYGTSPPSANSPHFFSGPPSDDSLLKEAPAGPFRGPGAPGMSSGASTPTMYSSPGGGGPGYLPSNMTPAPSSFGLNTSSSDSYPAWTTGQQVPISKEEIEDVFIDLASKFGFQRDSMRNMYDLMMCQLDSRASRMSPSQALVTLHADYIGGEHANYRKWYFAAQLDLDDLVGSANAGSGLGGLARSASKKVAGGGAHDKLSHSKKSLDGAHTRWRQAMANMVPYDRVRQVALYLLLWGEAAQVRFTPECLCFIFKCADDYYRSEECQRRMEPVPEGLYLRAVVRPLYTFLRDQGYEVGDGGAFVRKEKDHEEIIGYDDVNQLFWYPEGIARIVLNDKSRLVDYPPAQRFMKFDKIDWDRAFFKTYFERRSFLHLLVNFNRIWVIHITAFWMFTAFNSQVIYAPSGSTKASNSMTISAVAFGGAVATLIMLGATLVEFSYVPTTWNNTSHLVRRMVFLLVILALTGGPTIWVHWFSDQDANVTMIISIVQLAIAFIVSFMFGLLPSGRMFGDRVAGKSRKYLANQTFTASYHPLSKSSRLTSLALWLLVFACKGVESYFFLTLSFKNPIQAMTGMRVAICEDKLFGHSICRFQPVFTLAIMFVMDLVLFFLDTFLWFVVWNTVFSIARSFRLGLSLWTPWAEIFTRLPKRIYAKVLAAAEMEVRYKPKVLVSQIWNAVIISMYREHLLSIEHVQQLLYHQAASEDDGKRTLRAPVFFLSQGQPHTKSEFFPRGSEAERRIAFFAQSLTTEMPQPLPVEGMPTFTVLTPHYSEKILLSLREIIREEDQKTRVTMLEYLKQLHPIEWQNFVRDTKILAEETEGMEDTASTDEKSGSKKADDIPFYTIGFKSAAPEYTLRTRIWASLRAQTLYRTVSGFMNYNKAIKLLYRVENPEVVAAFGGNTEYLEHELERMARRKFKFVVSMQRYSRFSKEEIDNTEFLLRAYPDLQIAYLETQRPSHEGGVPRIFSALIDGHSEILENGKRQPKFRIELPGNPILGDGKADNQNNAIIFYRGEYIQLIDANQDNYLEECLKVRNVLGEFEEYDVSSQNPYGEGAADFQKHPVAIVGAREYIFSENIGILGDVAAGKEQTFGTLAARTMAHIGGKLHYGHPDFLSGIYMNTRGGVSKGQKGLHLNEDIYAGMTAIGRGGRIKHTEYYQCGKGRDLGFGTILNFQTKIGTGMGEQMLSREYYYMGTQLPIDRFLSFYYGHPGFHLHNIFVILAVQCFMVTLVFLGTMNSELDICKYQNGLFVGNQGCYNLVPVYDWIRRSVLSIFLVFAIAFLPLFLQELTERGIMRALFRLAKHFGSLSPLFEVFSTQISAHSILTNLTYGGARYIATGRGFATSRISFAILYSRFAGPSIYLGIRTGVMLLYITLALWIDYLIYFWFTVLALCLSPFIFNPHQFSAGDFLVDYREYLRWMSRGNSKSHANSWIGYCRLSRTQITGYKKKKLGHPSEKLAADAPRAKWSTVIVSEILAPLALAIIFTIAYMFVKSQANPSVDALVRILIVSVGPIAVNAALLLVLFFISMCGGPMFAGSCTNFGSVMAAIAHFGSVVVLVAFFEFLWFMEIWNASHAVLGLLAMMSIQRFLFKASVAIFLSREFKHDEVNRAWWTGKWYGNSWSSGMAQPFREFVVKTIEMSMFAADFIAGHFILFFLSLPLLIPYIDKLHSTMLFWLRPSKQIHAPIYSFKQKAKRKKIVALYGTIYLGVLVAFIALIALPLAFKDHISRWTGSI